MNLQPAIDLIKHFEGCVLRAYKDVPGGTWTIGYGHTKGVHKGMAITQAKAIELLHEDLAQRVPLLSSLIKVPITQNQFCALLSFSYNVGLPALEGSTLLRKLNKKAKKSEIGNEFLKWVRAGDHVLAGLVRRRKAERELFISPSIDLV